MRLQQRMKWERSRLAAETAGGGSEGDRCRRLHSQAALRGHSPPGFPIWHLNSGGRREPSPLPPLYALWEPRECGHDRSGTPRGRAATCHEADCREFVASDARASVHPLVCVECPVLHQALLRVHRHCSEQGGHSPAIMKLVF